ncbi:hypothetical protein ABT59_10225 [Enterococcus cecorum]|uniref:hypothetical protein n=1 Tax=Enterococcus cecorum TaxID=44008 RepID=UPI0006416E40|nr:hypothetical protein [Enterococcus cecorum]KLN91486.1 hypothetical protein ABT59_10225 [Enterococcus cecorum]KLN92465.1 hypothetical protein ABT60_08360 [Enterococcus cecorum]
MSNKKDLTGMRFGKLIVLEETDQRKHGRIVWKCRCDCGNMTYATSTQLISGKRTSCGCNNAAIDITNKRFGKLVAIKPIDKDKYGYTQWLCKCDCGNYATYAVNTLTKGAATSCGCIKKNKENARKRGQLSAKAQAEKSIEGVRPSDFNKTCLSNNTSGYTGVYKKGNKWCAEIIVKGTKYRMFGFETAEQAYREGRLILEEKYLPDEINKKP